MLVLTKSVPKYVYHKCLVKKLTEVPRSSWGEILRCIREEQDISQRQLAELAQVNRNVLRRLEKNESSTNIEVIERVAAVLGYELDLLAIQKSPVV